MKINPTIMTRAFVIGAVLTFSCATSAYAEQEYTTDNIALYENINGVLIEEDSTEADISEEEASKREAPQEEEHEAMIELLQDGYFVNAHFGAPRRVLLRSSKEDILRERVNAAFDNLGDFIIIDDLDYSTDDLETLGMVYSSCIHANRFYISGRYYYYSTPDKKITKLKIIYDTEFSDADGNPDTSKITSAWSLLNARAEKAISYASQGKDDLEKILLAHDWIALECEYDYDDYLAGTLPDKSYSAYGCLVDGIAVCSGYALAYSYILEELGIESYIASSQEMSHAWNLVNIDGSWWHIDLTWDDPVFENNTGQQRVNDDYVDEGYVTHDYFLKNDEEMQQLDHHGWMRQQSGMELPSSVSTDPYDNALFRAYPRSSYIFCGNNWYYNRSGRVYQTDDLWGSNEAELASRGFYNVICKEKVYFTDLLNNIVQYDPLTGETTIVFTSTDTITEFGSRNDKICYVTEKDGVFEHNIYNVPDDHKYEPVAVAIQKCVPYEGKIKIVWEQNTDMDGYVIYYSQDISSGYKVLKNITDSGVNSYNHKTTETGWFYKIRSYLLDEENVKHYSDYSEPIEGVSLPAKMTGFQGVELSNGKIKFVWEACPGADGYIISQSEDGGTTFKTVKNLNDGTILSYNTNPSTVDRKYRIRAYRYYMGNRIYGAYSDLIDVYMKMPAPASFTANYINETKIRLDWEAVEQADGYIIYRSDGTGSYKAIKTISTNDVTSYTNRVESGIEYHYRIYAYRLINGEKIKGNKAEA